MKKEIKRVQISFKQKIIIEPKPLQRPPMYYDPRFEMLEAMAARSMEIVIEKIIIPQLCGPFGRVMP